MDFFFPLLSPLGFSASICLKLYHADEMKSNFQTFKISMNVERVVAPYGRTKLRSIQQLPAKISIFYEPCCCKFNIFCFSLFPTCCANQVESFSFDFANNMRRINVWLKSWLIVVRPLFSNNKGLDSKTNLTARKILSNPKERRWSAYIPHW